MVCVLFLRFVGGIFDCGYLFQRVEEIRTVRKERQKGKKERKRSERGKLQAAEIRELIQSKYRAQIQSKYRPNKMDRLIKCLIFLAFILCCCIHSTAQSNSQQSGWGPWDSWAPCPVTCGSGMRTRQRTYYYASDDPRSSNKPFTNTELMECSFEACPVNGNWTSWGTWEECTAACGGGTRQRQRYCTNPHPKFGGDDCKGDAVDKEGCKEDPCPPTPAFFDMSQCKKETNFTCTNELMCVPLRQLCDDTVQCSDGSDEMGCRRSRYKIGRVHFSNGASTHPMGSSMVAVMAVLFSSWLVKVFIGGAFHTLDQSTSLRP